MPFLEDSSFLGRLDSLILRQGFVILHLNLSVQKGGGESRKSSEAKSRLVSEIPSIFEALRAKVGGGAGGNGGGGGSGSAGEGCKMGIVWAEAEGVINGSAGKRRLLFRFKVPLVISGTKAPVPSSGTKVLTVGVRGVKGAKSVEADGADLDCCRWRTKCDIMSTGTGKIMVVFFSLPILLKVCNIERRKYWWWLPKHNYFKE